MNLNLKYEVTVTPTADYFEVGIKIPKSDIDLKKKNAHEINMVFNQISLFADGLEHSLSNQNQDTKRSLHKIVNDLDQISKEICWIKSIHQAIKNKVIELSKGSFQK